MTKDEFDILYVNISAIATKIFSIKSNDILTGFAESITDDINLDNEAEITAFSQALSEINELGLGGEQDNDSLLQEGYASIDDLKDKFNYAYEKIDTDKLSELYKALPNLNIGLTNKISGNQLDICVETFLKEEHHDAFNDIHQYTEELFYDPSIDLITQCLSEENINILIENEDQINPKAISFENIEDAVLFKTLDILEWLSERYSFEPHEYPELLENASDDILYFQEVLKRLKPDEEAKKLIVSAFEKNGHVELSQAVKQYQ